MNTAAILEEYAAALRTSLAVAGGILASLPVRCAVDNAHAPESGVILTVTGYDEIVPGNHTYTLSCAAALRIKPEEHAGEDITSAWGRYGLAVETAAKALVDGSVRDAGYAILHAVTVPSSPAVDDRVWLFDATFDLTVQF